MPDVFLRQGAVNPSDVILKDPIHASAGSVTVNATPLECDGVLGVHAASGAALFQAAALEGDGSLTAPTIVVVSPVTVNLSYQVGTGRLKDPTSVGPVVIVQVGGGVYVERPRRKTRRELRQEIEAARVRALDEALGTARVDVRPTAVSGGAEIGHQRVLAGSRAKVIDMAASSALVEPRVVIWVNDEKFQKDLWDILKIIMEAA